MKGTKIVFEVIYIQVLLTSLLQTDQISQTDFDENKKYKYRFWLLLIRVSHLVCEDLDFIAISLYWSINSIYKEIRTSRQKKMTFKSNRNSIPNYFNVHEIRCFFFRHIFLGTDKTIFHFNWIYIQFTWAVGW